jgi:2-(1,2-epoxy-1,2-dihydrophenyl)acetyl-CoA isomerase
MVAKTDREQTDAYLQIDIADGVATMRLNRPDVLNAINIAMLNALRDALYDFRRRPDVRALVITGNGRAFCSGIDLADPLMNIDVPLDERGRRFTTMMDESVNLLMRDLYAFNKPKVAAVNGLAVGGGCGLAFVADIVLAARSSYFLQPFTPKLGIVPDMGVTWFLPNLLGRARALGLTMLGEKLTAEQAAEWGVIWRSVDDEALAGEAAAIAKRLSEGPADAYALLPGIMDKAFENNFSAQLDLERDVQARLVQTHDAVEAVTAFREKRPARFRGHG